MTDATKLPTLKHFRWARPTAARPTLAAGVDGATTDDTLTFTAPALDEAGVVLTEHFVIGIKRKSGSNRGYIELVYIPAGALSVDGLVATSVIRGIDPSGIDFDTADSSFAVAHDAGEQVFCAVAAVEAEMITATIQGAIATGGNQFELGDGTNNTHTLKRRDATDTQKEWLRHNGTAVQFSDDGSTYVNINNVTGSNLAVVSANDTTPGVLNGKIVDDGDTITVTELNDGGNETFEIKTGYTATSTEIDTALTGIGVGVTAANLDTLTDGSNADSLHTHETSTIDVTTAEAIDGSTTPQAISLLGNNFRDMLLIPANSQTFFSRATGTLIAFGDTDTSTRRAQSFIITDAEATTIVLDELTILLQKVASPGDNLTIEIQGDSAGAPDGTAITNGTSVAKTGASISADEQPVKFTWSTPPTLVSGTTYWAVFRRSGANDAVNYYELRDTDSNNYANGTGATFTASGPSWANLTNDFQLIMLMTVDYDGDVIRAVANESRRGNFIGFTKSNVGAGATAELIGENYINGFTGLSIGARYFIDTSSGAITTTPPAVGGGVEDPNVRIQAGIAVKADTIELQRSFTSLLEITTVFGSGQSVYEGSGSITFDVLVDCGFRPNDFEIAYTRNNVDGASADDRYVQKKAIGTTETEFIHFEPVPFGSVATIDTTTVDVGVKVQSIHENGYLLRFTCEHSTEDIVTLSIITRA